METIIATLEQEISKLQQARAILAGAQTVTRATGRRHMSAEGRQRIIEAQKRRWAKFHSQK